MKFSLIHDSLSEAKSDSLVLFVGKSGKILNSDLPSKVQTRAEQILSLGHLGDEPGSLLPAPIDLKGSNFNLICLMRVGQQPMSIQSAERLISSMAGGLAKLGCPSCTLDLRVLEVSGQGIEWLVRRIPVLINRALYRFEEFKSKKKKASKWKSCFLLTAEKDSLKQALKTGVAVSKGLDLCRDLGNRPGNACTPADLVAEAEKLAGKYDNIELKILDEAEMEKQGMGSFLSVSAGSDQPAYLIHLSYWGADRDQRPLGLVGKGITFDTGGISLKPGAAMDEMKYDMCGAASVIGSLKTIAEMNWPINVMGFIAAAENMPSGKATKPGDIVTSKSGKTIEVLNTDAEGRLVLCDALTYAQEFKPEVLIDIATLTGACVIALGSHASGLYANNDELAEQLLAAGQESGDRAWRMPLWPEYTKQLESPFADLANIGGREAGSVTAACFLAEFTKKARWAHLDVAGTAWVSGKNKGATGRPLELLTEFVRRRAE